MAGEGCFYYRRPEGRHSGRDNSRRLCWHLLSIASAQLLYTTSGQLVFITSGQLLSIPSEQLLSITSGQVRNMHIWALIS